MVGLVVAACTGSGGGLYGGASPPANPAAAPAASAAASAGSSGSAAAGMVEIKDFAFTPPTISISAGETVTWTNGDGVAHTVTLDDGSVNSGNIDPGATFSQAFAGAGTFPYHCSIHPAMKATVQAG